MAGRRTKELKIGLRPSEVFATRLRETRGARNMSQRGLAEAMTQAGRPLNKVAVLRLERGPHERVLSLDEALALARVLTVAPAHLLSPRDDEGLVALTDQFAVDGAALRNWLLFGQPILGMTEEGQRVQARMELVFTIEAYAQALVDAKRGGDTAGVNAAVQAILRTAVEGHRDLRSIGEGES